MQKVKVKKEVKEEELRKEMYHLGYQDAVNKREYGSSLEENVELTLKDLGMEQMKLF